MVLCCGLFLGVLFRHYEEQAFEQLAAEASYIVHGMDLSGEDYLDTLESSTARVTWVDDDGTVLYDSVADAADMENHLDRGEIDGALENGTGRDIRFSETMLQRNLYYAVRLEDGSVLRVSCAQGTAVSMLLMIFWPMLGIVLAVLLLCALLAFRLARHIVDPINQIDLDHPLVDETYSELAPLVSPDSGAEPHHPPADG